MSEYDFTLEELDHFYSEAKRKAVLRAESEHRYPGEDIIDEYTRKYYNEFIGEHE